MPALAARAEWIRAVVEGEVDLRDLPKAAAEAEIARRGLGDPGPLLGMSLLSMTKERYAALLQERDRKADELRELDDLLAEPVDGIDRGRRAVCEAIETGALQPSEVLPYCLRQASRDTALMRPAMGSLADRHAAPLRLAEREPWHGGTS